MRRYGFVQLDVFASRPLAGNPLAVFTDGRGLSDVRMQALAREMNLSETTFILPRAPQVERKRGVQVRIFTPEEELPFAGHPTLGTAAVLRRLRRAQVRSSSKKSRARGAAEVALDLRVGKIPVVFREEPGGRVFGEMRQRDPEFGAVHSRETVAKLLGLSVDDLASEPPIETVSTGVPFAIVPIRSLKTLSGLRLNWGTLSKLGEQSDAKYCYLVSRETEDPQARLHARMVFSNGEDPATGSAAGCAAAWMVRHGVAEPDEQVLIEQGLEVKRPSQIYVRASREGDRVTNVRVGGNVVEVMRGEVFF